MKIVTLFIHSLLLLSTVSLAATPMESTSSQDHRKWIPPTTVEEIEQLIDDLESGVYDDYSEEEQERIAIFVITLVRMGTPPERREALEREIEMLFEDDGP